MILTFPGDIVHTEAEELHILIFISMLDEEIQQSGSEYPGPLHSEKCCSIGLGKPFPPPLPDPNIYVVEFEGPLDPTHPHNWAPSVR